MTHLPRLKRYPGHTPRYVIAVLSPYAYKILTKSVLVALSTRPHSAE